MFRHQRCRAGQRYFGERCCVFINHFFSAVVSVAVLLLLVTSILGRSCDRWSSSSSLTLFLVVSSHLPPLATARYRPHLPPGLRGFHKRAKTREERASCTQSSSETAPPSPVNVSLSTQILVPKAVVVVVEVFFGPPLSIVIVVVGMSSMDFTMDIIFFFQSSSLLLLSLSRTSRRRRRQKRHFLKVFFFFRRRRRRSLRLFLEERRGRETPPVSLRVDHVFCLFFLRLFSPFV